jgi:hypothetical protein
MSGRRSRWPRGRRPCATARRKSQAEEKPPKKPRRAPAPSPAARTCPRSNNVGCGIQPNVSTRRRRAGRRRLARTRGCAGVHGQGPVNGKFTAKLMLTRIQPTVA